jgi:hypothetical protein
MRVSEVLDFDTYYRDQRFSEKRASNRSWHERCGDNIYFRNEAGQWVQACAYFHTSPEQMAQDTRYPWVFISDHFFYFGENAPAIPEEFTDLVQTRQGCTYHEGQIVLGFIEWLERRYQPGLHGEPRDREQESETRCELVPTANMIPNKALHLTRPASLVSAAHSESRQAVGVPGRAGELGR